MSDAGSLLCSLHSLAPFVPQKSDPPTEEEKKQPTPPPDQWAEILGIPGEDDSKSDPSSKSYKPSENSETSSDNVSPKVLRSSKKTPDTKSPTKIVSPPKKRRQDFKSPEPEKGKKKEKTDKRKRKSEKE